MAGWSVLRPQPTSASSARPVMSGQEGSSMALWSAKGTQLKNFQSLSASKAPAAILALHRKHPFDGALHTFALTRFIGRASLEQRKQHHGGVIDVGVKLVSELEGPTGGLRMRPLFGPVTFTADLFREQPIGAAAESVVRRICRFAESKGGDCGIPNGGKAGLEVKAAFVIDEQAIKLSLRLHAKGMISRVAQQIESHDGILHGGVDRTQAVAAFKVLDHPLRAAMNGIAPDKSRSVALPDFEAAIEEKKGIPPAKCFEVAFQSERSTGKIQLI